MTQDPPRYSAEPFPPYTYVPGRTPHPVSDPAGHMYGHEPPKPPPLDPANWQRSETYLYGVDLFNHGFYWEAHEAWESLWHAAGRRGVVADFLKGLIKLAAAGVKSLEGNPAGIARHTDRAEELLSSVMAIEQTFCGLDLQRLCEQRRSEESSTIWLQIKQDPCKD
jgi:hypothetical protein